MVSYEKSIPSPLHRMPERALVFELPEKLHMKVPNYLFPDWVDCRSALPLASVGWLLNALEILLSKTRP